MLKCGGFSFSASGGGRVKFTKPPLTYEQQADLLLARGLVADKAELIQRLTSVSYYRLCAYWYPFKRPDNSFEPGTTFESVWRRYTFDRQLRLIVMDAIERVEITLRTGLAYELTHQFGPFAQLDAAAFPSIPPHERQRLLDVLHDNALHSREAFVEHFRRTYDEFPDLPLWAAVETTTFGQMFTIYRNCGKHVQRDIAASLHLTGKVLFSWLLTLNYVRNLCAHHARLWNRELALKPIIPYERRDARWHGANPIQNNRVFVVITLLRFLLSESAPQSHWKGRLYSLFDRYPEIPLSGMGIPNDWRNHVLWQ
jgi:abortive infection bacteriophage resistance protein